MELPQKFCIPVRYDITNLVRKLRPGNPVHHWLKRHIATGESPAEALFKAVAHNDASAWADRAVAYHLLGLIELSPPERKKASHLLLETLISSDRNAATTLARILYSVLITMPLVMILLLLFRLIELTFGTFNGERDLVLPFVSILTGACVYKGLGWLDQKRLIIVKQAAATALVRVGNPVCIVTLARYVHRLSIQPPPIREEAIQALRAILPMVTSDWYGRLPAGTCEALIDLVGWFDEDTNLNDLALETLDALERVADGNCIKPVERIASRARADCTRERAATILPTIVARRDCEEASTTLLRPSAGVRTDHLVRPVYGSDPDVANLLRASDAASPGARTDDRKL